MNVISKLFRSGASAQHSGAREPQRISRRSNGLNELSRSLEGEGLRVLDLGPTSPQNIAFFTGLGHRIHNEDVLLASGEKSLLVRAEDGTQVPDPKKFLEENLDYEREFFDAVLCWDTPDYLHTDLVKPVVQRIHSILKPQGLLLAFFHTKDAGSDAPYHRYHIAAPDTLEMQQIVPSASSHHDERNARQHFRLQRVFNNRHIENLFHDYASIKFFLGRDNIREVLVVR